MDLIIPSSGFSENWIMLGQGMFFVALAWYYKRNPPKEINSFYGYRTRRSMANLNIWKVANAQNAKDFFKVAIATLIAGLLLMLFSFKLRILIQVFVLLVGIGVAIWNTETQLNKQFDKNGNRKST